jgi:hypothetical protein
MKVSELAKLYGTEPTEYVVELPFAAELWQRVFAELNPPKNVLLEFGAGSLKVRTSQQVGTLKESGEIVFENIEIRFSAVASFEKVIWSEYTYHVLIFEQGLNKSEKEELEKKISDLETKVFEGDEDARKEREGYRENLRFWDRLLKKNENILEKLPAAYEELKQNESAQFHYSIFLAPGDGKRKLRILTTKP